MWDNLKILLTGNTGFVGKHIGNYLLKKGHIIEGISRKKSNQDYLTHHLNLQNSVSLNNISSKIFFDCIIHCASLTKESDINLMFKNNVLSTLNILNFCKLKKIKKFILISGHNVYSPYSKIPITEKSKTNPSTNYGLTKLLQENLTEFYAKNHSIDAMIFRLSYIYGPNQSLNKMIPSMIKKYINSEPIILHKYKNGFQKIDVINIYDICKIIEEALKIKKSYEIFNISSGKSITVEDILEILKQNIKSNSSISIKKINKKINHFQYDISHAKNILNYKPTVNLEKGIKELIDNFTL